MKIPKNVSSGGCMRTPISPWPIYKCIHNVHLEYVYNLSGGCTDIVQCYVKDLQGVTNNKQHIAKTSTACIKIRK